MKSIIDKIVQLPKVFYDKGDISMHSLLKETGYFGVHKMITTTDILKSLSAYPQCSDYWLQWSENKKSNVGWYFKEGEGRFLVGYFSTK